MGIVRTVLVIGVAVGIGYLVTQQQGVVRRPAFTPYALLPTPELLLLNDSSATLMDLAGSSTRMTRTEFERLSTHDSRLTPIEGGQAANGSAVTYGKELRSPDHRLVATLGAPKGDGASVIEITSPPAPSPSLGEGVSTLVLRIGKTPLRDARVHGWADIGTMLVSGIVTSTRAIVAVRTDGSLRELATLPDNVLSLEARRGAIWHITASPGEGIESDPVPPSELHRVTVAYGDELVVREDSRLILNAVAGPSNDVAYLTDDGQATYLKIGDDTSKTSLGKRHPILFLADGSLVLRDNFDLVRTDPKTGETDKIGTLPEGVIEVYEMPRTP